MTDDKPVIPTAPVPTTETRGEPIIKKEREQRNMTSESRFNIKDEHFKHKKNNENDIETCPVPNVDTYSDNSNDDNQH